MFDIGFAELVVIAVIALVVMGPERLPTAMRFVALWLGRIRRQYRKIRQELEDEMGLDDVRRQLHNENILKELEENKPASDSPQKTDKPAPDSQDK